MEWVAKNQRKHFWGKETIKKNLSKVKKENIWQLFDGVCLRESWKKNEQKTEWRTIQSKRREILKSDFDLRKKEDTDDNIDDDMDEDVDDDMDEGMDDDRNEIDDE